jgi:uncharacterized protein with HEPN domain
MARQKSTRHRLFAILSAIRHIEIVVAGVDEQAFKSDFRLYRLVERELEIISEASRSLTEQQKARFPDIPWRRIADIGNVLRHQYDDVAPGLLWGVILDGIQPLKAATQALYAEAKRPADPWPGAEGK